MSSRTETFNTNLYSRKELHDRRAETRRKQKARKLGMQTLAVVGATVAFSAGSLSLSHRAPNHEQAKLRAALIANSSPTMNPNVVIEHYQVGESPSDTMLSEVASDLHPLAKNQDGMDEIQTLETYLTANEQGSTSFTPGRTVEVKINTESGEILPNSYDINSGDNRG